MAYIIYQDKQKRNLPAGQGIRLWQGLQDPTGLDEQQLDYLKTIKSLYLNWRSPETPDSYIEANLPAIIPLALNEWRYTVLGVPIKPATEQAWAFARKWGLWFQGRPTKLVTGRAA